MGSLLDPHFLPVILSSITKLMMPTFKALVQSPPRGSIFMYLTAYWYLIVLSFFLIYYFFLTLQYCIGFATHQHESATGVHMFPIQNPPPTHPHTIPPGHPSAELLISLPLSQLVCIPVSSISLQHRYLLSCSSHKPLIHL